MIRYFKSCRNYFFSFLRQPFKKAFSLEPTMTKPSPVHLIIIELGTQASPFILYFLLHSNEASCWRERPRPFALT